MRCCSTSGRDPNTLNISRGESGPRRSRFGSRCRLRWGCWCWGWWGGGGATQKHWVGALDRAEIDFAVMRMRLGRFRCVTIGKRCDLDNSGVEERKGVKQWDEVLEILMLDRKCLNLIREWSLPQSRAHRYLWWVHVQCFWNFAFLRSCLGWSTSVIKLALKRQIKITGDTCQLSIVHLSIDMYWGKGENRWYDLTVYTKQNSYP
jgi:hypothetical protein